MPVDELTDERSIVGRVQELLTDAVRLRMVADVPVGFFLSGGVDSSAVVAAAAEVSGSPLKTFTIGFEDGAFDEREAARYVARKYGTEHHEFVVRPADLECLQDIVWHADEPFGDPSALAVWHLSSFTRKHVTVALSGDGADEMCAGYDSYRGDVLSEQLRRFPRVLRDLAARCFRGLPSGNASRRASFLRLARNIEDAQLPGPERFATKQQFAFRRERLAECSPRLAPLATVGSDRLLHAVVFEFAEHPLVGMTLYQQTVGLPDQMLTKVDRMSMAASLEVRAPFLDHRIAELMNTVSMGTKLPAGRQEYVLRKAMERYYPRDFPWQKKRGFVPPLASWFKSELAGHIRQRLLAPGSLSQALFRRECLEIILGEHRTLERDWSSALWALLISEEWCLRFGITADALEFGGT